VKLSDILRWGLKKSESDHTGAAAWARDRRQSAHRLAGGGWLYWTAETGEPQRARVNFVEGSGASTGLRFRTSRSPADGAVCWALPEGERAFPCAIVRTEKIDQGGCLVDAAMDFQDHFAPGPPGSRVQWVDDSRTVHSLPAAVRNSGQGLIEVSLPVNVPARRMVFLDGPGYGCLAVCRGSRPDGSRFILVAEAASDSFVTAPAAA
jgi:hypothetical protein